MALVLQLICLIFLTLWAMGFYKISSKGTKKFASESSVHKLYSYTRNMKTNLRLVPYIPKQFYHRYKDLESLAYNLRHSGIKYKTRVKMGTSDLILYKRKPSEIYWTVALPSAPAILSNDSTSPNHLNLRPNSGVISKKSNQE